MPYVNFSYLCFTWLHFIFKDMFAYQKKLCWVCTAAAQFLNQLNHANNLDIQHLWKNTFACIFRGLTSDKWAVNFFLWKYIIEYNQQLSLETYHRFFSSPKNHRQFKWPKPNLPHKVWAISPISVVFLQTGRALTTCLVFSEQWVWSERCGSTDTNSSFPVSINHHCQQLQCQLGRSNSENILLDYRHTEVILLPHRHVSFLQTIQCHVVCSPEEHQWQVSDNHQSFSQKRPEQFFP